MSKEYYPGKVIFKPSTTANPIGQQSKDGSDKMDSEALGLNGLSEECEFDYKKYSVYEGIGASVGELVSRKNIAYGDSFAKTGNVLTEMFPNGIKPEKYGDALAIVRVLDKLFRIASAKDAFGENPWEDICGYSILSIANIKNKREE